MSSRKCLEIDDSPMMAGMKVSQNIFNNLHMILDSWNSVIKEVVFTFEVIYICHVYMQNKLPLYAE